MNALELAVRAKRFLIVDDNAFQRKITQEILRGAGAVKIECAASAQEAMDSVSILQPDVLLCDWVMEHIDGVEFTRMIRAGETPIRRDVGVIMVTGRNTRQDAEFARHAGVDEFLIKPFNTTSMLARLDAILFHKREFVEATNYAGPCRRRLPVGFDVEARRATDQNVADQDATLRQVATQQLLNAVKLSMAARRDRSQLAALAEGAKSLERLFARMEDSHLSNAAKSLHAYVLAAEGVVFDPRVVDAHLDAMSQLLDIPRSNDRVRAAVEHALHDLVRRKTASP